MIKMTNNGTSVNWILAISGAALTGFLYLVCCVCSIHKALKDRKKIIERNCAKRNKKYLKEMGLDSEKQAFNSGKTRFAISKHELEPSQTNEIQINDIKPPVTLTEVYMPTKAKKINLDDIEEILNESISVNVSTSSSLVAKSASDNSQQGNPIYNDETRKEQKIVTSLRKPNIIESVPKLYYLKAHNPHLKDNVQTVNWVTERLNTASSFADAQRQLQYGLKRAPLAKQNSGFSSMDEDSSASFNY